MDRLTPERRTAVMRSIRSRDTRPELIVRRLVSGLGFRYRLHDRALPGTPDLVFGRHRKAIFVNGCYWHQHRGCARAFVPRSHTSYWLPKLRKNTERDSANIEALNAIGFSVLTVWECELDDLGKLSRRLARFLRS